MLFVQKQKVGEYQQSNLMIKHMRITDRGNEISSNSPLEQNRNTMIFVIGRVIASGGTLDSLAWVHHEFSSIYGIIE